MKRISVKAKFAFTLAELLIVIGVIGIVAQMTIPPLVHNVEVQSLKAGFLKAYRNLALTMQSVVLEEGDNYLATISYDNLRSAIYGHYDVSKESWTRPATRYWWTYNNVNYYTWADNIGVAGYESRTKLLKDGSLIFVNDIAPYYNGLKAPYDFKYVVILIDTNGPYKKPNRAGYDLWSFVMWGEDVPNKISLKEPSVNTYCSTASGNDYQNGLSCAYYALNDINPDDPSKGYWASLK